MAACRDDVKVRATLPEENSPHLFETPPLERTGIEVKDKAIELLAALGTGWMLSIRMRARCNTSCNMQIMLIFKKGYFHFYPFVGITFFYYVIKLRPLKYWHIIIMHFSIYDFFSQGHTRKRKFECSHQESNLRNF